MKPPEWMRHAACLGADPEMFFEAAREDDAKAVCRGCPVRLECLRCAKTERIEHGVWGGETPTERRGKGRGKPIVHGTYNGYRKHRRRGEVACDECLRANSDYQAYRKDQRGEAPQFVKCAYPFGCEQWAMKGGTMCWPHAHAQENLPVERRRTGS